MQQLLHLLFSFTLWHIVALFFENGRDSLWETPQLLKVKEVICPKNAWDKHGTSWDSQRHWSS